MPKPNRMKFTKALLDRLQSSKPEKQELYWDTVQTGLCVLVSPGPAHKRRATVTFRVVYYLKSQPGKPKYKRLAGYPEQLSDIDAARREASKVRNAAADGKVSIGVQS